MNFLIKRIFYFLLFILFNSCDYNNDLKEEDLKVNMIDEAISGSRIKSKSVEERKSDLKNAYGVISTLPDGIEKVNKLREISIEYYKLKDQEKFIDLNYKALKMSTVIGDSIGSAKAYGNIGIYYRNRELDSAYKNFYEADKIYMSLDNSGNYDPLKYAFDHGKVLIDLAKLSQKVKDYAESEELTIRAIEKFESSGNLTYVPLSYSNLGTVAKYLGRYDDAVEYHLKAIEAAKNTPKDTLYATVSYNNIGTVYKSQKKYKKAKEFYDEGLAFESFLAKKPKRYARLLDNLAYVKFLSNNDDDDVLFLFNKALKIRDSVNDLVGIATNALHLAEYHHSRGNDSVALYYGERARITSEQMDNNIELLRSYQLLSEISDSNVGLKYAQKYIRLNDSIVNDERAFRDKFARIRFETEEKVEKIAQISRENQYLIFAILGLSVLFLLGYVIFRQQQSNKELLFEQKQQQSNQEIYRLLLSQQLKLEEGRKMEQHRMSEELHDGVLGRLFGVRLSLDGINQRANDGFTDARNKYIEELKSIEREIRLISHDLGTETLSPDIAYVDVVESLVSDLCTVHKMEFEFANDENIDWEVVDDQKKVNLFRIIQESLQNIFKHAKAKSVKINFDYVDDKINLTILDDGIGFKSSKVKRGIGLKNITSRVTQMNGVVDFISNQDAGTKVSVGIPI
ncbi:sensor histidine kinase [uncultured Aquimarina sp.]|uniref:tetratricopeptide repeat-containing sensor histidine kinase n=1 Tax=uncultured Aquimarina sp. TaxID=575652 RepID=UPI0026184216|nr:sensor histidine kinase [uncultured Aquimarina sp.]